MKDPRQDSAARVIISSESIAGFRVSSSLYSAESGTAAGGQVASTSAVLVPQRTFFFVNYEGLRQRQTQSFTRFVPSAAYRAGVTGALAPLVGLFPAGTGRTSEPAIDEWQGTNRVTADENAGLVRVDQRVSRMAPDISSARTSLTETASTTCIRAKESRVSIVAIL